MKIQIRLNSIVPNGVGGPEAGAINIIYAYLMNEFNQNAYSYISINQIGDDSDVDEVLIKDGKDIYLNIRYPSPEDFELRNDIEKNKIRLDVLHAGLLRIAEKEKKLDIQSLNAIKEKVLSNNFSFYFVLKTYLNKKNSDLIAKLIVHPLTSHFEYYIHIEKSGHSIYQSLIYLGNTTGMFVADLFGVGKWAGNNKFILTGKRKDVKIHVFIDQQKIEYENLTPYDKAPLFQLMRSDISDEDKAKAMEDWKHSLPPHFAAAIREADN